MYGLELSSSSRGETNEKCEEEVDDEDELESILSPAPQILARIVRSDLTGVKQGCTTFLFPNIREEVKIVEKSNIE